MGLLAAVRCREGVTVSVSTAGRILRTLMDRGVVVPVSILRRNPPARRVRLTAKERYARRLPKGLKPTRPGEIMQVDTLFVNVRPDCVIKHFAAYDPVAQWTVGRVATTISAQAANGRKSGVCGAVRDVSARRRGPAPSRSAGPCLIRYAG